nr:DNA-primase RepB domain-containing protein [Deinococcus aestuarii]
MINEGDGRGRSNRNVRRVRAFFADFDGVPLPEKWPLLPSIIVETSPGRFHTYWLLDEDAIFPVENVLFNKRQEAIARAVGSAPDDCKGISRVMRVPGFEHQKHDAFVSRLLRPAVDQSPRLYGIEDIASAFPLVEEIDPPVERTSSKHVSLGGQNEARHRYAVEALSSELKDVREVEVGNRNKRLNKAAFRTGRLIGGGHMDEVAAREALIDAGRACGLDHGEVQRTVEGGIAAGKTHPDLLEKVEGVPRKGRRSDEADAKPSASRRLLGYALEDEVEFWHDDAGNAYLTFPIESHWEHVRLPSRAARDYAQNLFYQRERNVLPTQALSEALNLMQALARSEGHEYMTAIRAAHMGGCSYLDLGTSDWRAVRITASGWTIVPLSECPIRFVRPVGLLPLPLPVEGGSVQELGTVLNTGQSGIVLVTAWLLSALSGLKPFPLLSLSGEQGTGKSTASTILRNLIDPHKADRRRAPREERDLYIAAHNSYVLAFENLSNISDWLSDAFCVLSTGGVYTARKLYTDDEEVLLEAVRPVIVNGIPDLLTRPDLADRALSVMLERIPPERRLTERELWDTFWAIQPRVLGALCTVLSHALGHLDEVKLVGTPRLADFARLITAAEPALSWEEGTFMAEYSRMRNDAVVSVLEGDSVAEAVCALVDAKGEWRGTVKSLLEVLTSIAFGDTRPHKLWPTSPRHLGSALRRLAPALSEVGYEVESLGRGTGGAIRYRLFSTQTSTTFAVSEQVAAVRRNAPVVLVDEPPTGSRYTNVDGTPDMADSGNVRVQDATPDARRDGGEHGEQVVRGSTRTALSLWSGEVL